MCIQSFTLRWTPGNGSGLDERDGSVGDTVIAAGLVPVAAPDLGGIRSRLPTEETLMRGVCSELTPMLDQLYAVASVLDGRSRVVPAVCEPLTVVWFGGALLVAGEIDVDSAPELATALAPLTVPGSRLRVDLAAVTFIGSHGVRLLNHVAAALGPSGRLVLIAPSHSVRRAIELVGVHDRIDLHDRPDVGADRHGQGQGWSAPSKAIDPRRRDLEPADDTAGRCDRIGSQR